MLVDDMKVMTPAAPSTFGARLRIAREMSGAKMRELDAMAGMPEGNVWAMENSGGDVKAANASKVAKALHISLQWLIDGDGPAPSRRALQGVVAAYRLSRKKSA